MIIYDHKVENTQTNPFYSRLQIPNKTKRNDVKGERDESLDGSRPFFFLLFALLFITDHKRGVCETASHLTALC